MSNNRQRRSGTIAGREPHPRRYSMVETFRISFFGFCEQTKLRVLTSSFFYPTDVLPGASSFRLLEPVFEKINEGVKFPSQRDQYSCYFSTSMLSPNSNQSPSKITSANGNILPTDGSTTPSETSGSPTTVVQPYTDWYDSDVSDSPTKKLVDGFKSSTYL